MKQLTKEQHEEIKANHFATDFIPSCCDSCADGDECETDKKESRDRKEWLESKQTHVDRIPEETAGDYMDRVATINGRK